MSSDESEQLVHLLPAELLQRQVNVHLAGCGGTGSRMLTHLAHLHLAMVALGHPGGLHVTAFDPDTVTPANVGRQLFSRADLRRNKGDVLINRANAYWGLTWLSFAGRYEVIGTHPQAPQCDLLITCVDTASARRKIATELLRQIWRAPVYWLDLGNAQDYGQVVLTEVREPLIRQTIEAGAYYGGEEAPRTDAVLPPLWVYNADIFEDTYEEVDAPSCSLEQALENQGLFINAHMALWGAQILEELFRHGRLVEHGYWINTAPGIPFKVLPVKVRSVAENVAGMAERELVGVNG